ncbi:VOC family protein [Pelagibius sp. Alg239-R121]|uniref:VOC family protein n=1 Tax=Pelagibius sp. Alg239-R121 TaxID=2993448 RepID=UPI0024A6A7D6|nr:VOC family protein [Pelagibius sp. Alg239-R121]
MGLGKLKSITDICILVEDIEQTVEFYTKKLDFKLRRRAEGFADFHADGVTLAAWELDHISEHTGVSNRRSPKAAHKACVAVQLDSPASVDELHAELIARGVTFYGEPASYVWNARCAYFTDPDGTLWELYAWEEGGPGDYHETDEH